jgi:polyisoprenoid-binding protein YceI
MHKFMMTAVLGIAFAVSNPAAAACEYPPDVELPDGAKASEAEMNAASAVVKTYIADMDAYMACLDAEEAALPEEEKTPETRAMHVKRHNAAVDAENVIATRFNDQVKAFKAANK